jgi:hypothetical protein
MNRERGKSSKVLPRAEESRFDQFLRSRQGIIVAVLCGYAALRVLVFCAAFPLFNNVDEQYHFTSIHNFAEGRLPGKDLPFVDADSAGTFVLYGTLEYLNPPERLRRHAGDIPIYQLPAAEREAAYRAGVGLWTQRTNIEAQAPPLYYLVGAAWYKLGTVFGWQDWKAAYWIRFLNPIFYALLVWISYRLASLVYPGNAFLAVAIPAFIAVFPQDVFFGMNRDVLSAPIAAAALLLMAQAAKRERGALGRLLAASFLVGLAFLVNVSNCVLYGALAISLWFAVRNSDEPRTRKVWKITGSAIAALFLPVLWMLRNYLVMGDLTGSRAKIDRLGWTVKPWQDIFDHPIFSPSGLFYFLGKLTATFWRGELVWHGRPMRFVFADGLYVYSSWLLILVFVVYFFLRFKTSPAGQKIASLQALVVVAGAVVFMAAISLPFDFHDCVYPSSRSPFFVSGRIIACAMLPFAIIYASAFELLARRIRQWIHPAILFAGLLVFITVSEWAIRSAVFSSRFNFFALASWKG